MQLHNHMEFYQLVHLELCGDALMWWDLLTWMLQSSPKLQVLKIYEVNILHDLIHSVSLLDCLTFLSY